MNCILLIVMNCPQVKSAHIFPSGGSGFILSITTTTCDAGKEAAAIISECGRENYVRMYLCDVTLHPDVSSMERNVSSCINFRIPSIKDSSTPRASERATQAQHAPPSHRSAGVRPTVPMETWLWVQPGPEGPGRVAAAPHVILVVRVSWFLTSRLARFTLISRHFAHIPHLEEAACGFTARGQLL